MANCMWFLRGWRVVVVVGRPLTVDLAVNLTVGSVDSSMSCRAAGRSCTLTTCYGQYAACPVQAWQAGHAWGGREAGSTGAKEKGMEGEEKRDRARALTSVDA